LGNLFKQIVGWFLLLVGICIIAYGLYDSFNIFTGEKEAPVVFFLEKGNVVPSSDQGGVEEQMKQMVQEQLDKILPSSFIFRILNLATWSIFVGILIFGGAQISSLGIKLIK
jgi:hypothetical protein